MNMKDFHAWVKAGNFDKPREADDVHTSRLQEQNKDVLKAIQEITDKKTKWQKKKLLASMKSPKT